MAKTRVHGAHFSIYRSATSALPLLAEKRPKAFIFGDHCEYIGMLWAWLVGRQVALDHEMQQRVRLAPAKLKDREMLAAHLSGHRKEVDFTHSALKTRSAK